MPNGDDEILPDGTAAVPRRAVSPPKRPVRKDKVMVYVPPGLHRAMRRLAVDDDRSASDLYADAARAFLSTRGVNADEGSADGAPTPRRQGTIADLDAFADRLGSRIEATLARGEAPADDPHAAGSPAPAGTTTAAVTAPLGVRGERAEATDREKEALQARLAELTPEIAALRKEVAHLRKTEFWDRVIREIAEFLPEREWMTPCEIARRLPPSLAQEALAKDKALTPGLLHRQMRLRDHHGRFFEFNADGKKPRYRRRAGWTGISKLPGPRREPRADEPAGAGSLAT